MPPQLIVAFISGAVLVLVLLGIGLYILVRQDQRPVPPQAMFIFRVILALAGAAFAAILPGFLNIQARLLSIAIQAGGALAVFVVIYRINPPELLAQSVGKQPDAPRVKALISKLKHSEKERDRIRAALALGQLGDEARTAMPDLIEALNDPSANVREYSAQALERLGPDAVRSLIVALRHAKGLAVAGPTPMIRRQIPRLGEAVAEEDVRIALVKIGPHALPSLMDALRDAVPAVRPLVAAALSRIEGLNPRSTVEQALSSSDHDIRVSGAIALAENASPEDLPALAALLNDEIREVRVCGFSGLAKSGSKDAVRPLFEALKREPDGSVRTVATEALGELGLQVDEAIPPLIELLSDKSLSVQMGSIQALGKIGLRAAAAVPALALFLKNEDWHWRHQAVIALGEISSAAALPGLRAALEDPREDVRQAAAEALGRIQDG